MINLISEYLRTHPITSNRIADIENRLAGKIIQVIDSLIFFNQNENNVKVMTKRKFKKMKILKKQKV